MLPASWRRRSASTGKRRGHGSEHDDIKLLVFDRGSHVRKGKSRLQHAIGDLAGIVRLRERCARE